MAPIWYKRCIQIIYTGSGGRKEYFPLIVAELKSSLNQTVNNIGINWAEMLHLALMDIFKIKFLPILTFTS